MVPRDLKGDFLYPLNQLRDIYPELYLAKSQKYQGRERLMREIIQPLSCLWNDVLHFTAVHPKEINQALTSTGFKSLDCDFFEIDAELLEKDQTCVYLYDDYEVRNYVEYKIEDLNKYSFAPKETLGHYEKTKKLGERPLLFIRIPHILYKGKIDLKKTKRISIN